MFLTQKSVFRVFLVTVLLFIFWGITLNAVWADSAPIYNDVLKEKFDSAKQVGLPGTEEGELTLPDRIAMMINKVLTVLGLIFLIIIIAGGIKWMTAGGNEGNIDQAKKILTAGVVGMIIVFLAYGITAFIFNVVLSNPWGW